jgi:hypothetical protein
LAILPKAFGYPDLAATTLLTMRKIGESFPWRNIEEALEMMVPAHPFGTDAYRDYIAVFERNPDQFHATRLAGCGGRSFQPEQASRQTAFWCMEEQLRAILPPWSERKTVTEIMSIGHA